MQIYKNWLQSRNVKFNETPIGIFFAYQGKGFLISDNSDDELYFQLIMPNIYDVPAYEKAKAMDVINKLNKEIKCLKATLQDDNKVWLATEIFIDRTPNIEDYFDRLLGILFAGAMKFQLYIQ